jgi:flagellar hook-length control protein FliK
MAEIQAAMLAKFNLVAGAHKAGFKGALMADVQKDAFFGVLQSQLANTDSDAELAVPVLLGNAVKMPPIRVSVADTAQPAADLVALPPSDLSAQLSVAPAVPAAFTASARITVAQGMEDEPQRGVEPIALPEAMSEEINSMPTVATKSARPSVQENLLKAGGAAIAAADGQALPPDKPNRQSEMPVVQTSSSEADLLKAELSASIPISPSTQGRVDVSATPASIGAPFVQSLRQAEARINAAIETPLRSPAFAAELSDKVVWLASKQGQFAELSLNPPQMGALEVRLTLSGSDASAQFYSSNPVVREVIDGALPRLRELMAQAGINLGEAEVRQQAFSRRDQADQHAQPSTPEAEILMHHQAPSAGMGGAWSTGSGLVDLYI